MMKNLIMLVWAIVLVLFIGCGEKAEPVESVNSEK